MTDAPSEFTLNAVQPTYATRTEIHVNSVEFTVLFKTDRHGMDQSGKHGKSPVVVNGVVLAPLAAKKLSAMLASAIDDYERTVGPIPGSTAMKSTPAKKPQSAPKK